MTGIEALFAVAPMLSTAAGATTLAGSVGFADALIGGGSIISAIGQRQTGEAQQAALDASARQTELNAQAALDRNVQAAGQERAAGQRAFLSERRRGRLVRAGLIARAGASGADVNSPDIIRLSSDIESETDYHALTALYESEDRAQALEDQGRVGLFNAQTTGAMRRYRGRSMNRQGNFAAFSTIAGTANQFLERYA